MNFNFDDPYFLSSSDISQHSIVALVFSGSNYVNWSRSVKMALYARNKERFIDGTLVKPSYHQLISRNGCEMTTL